MPTAQLRLAAVVQPQIARPAKAHHKRLPAARIPAMMEDGVTATLDFERHQGAEAQGAAPFEAFCPNGR